eukprot:2233385-Prymnesium_polylepis.2
MHVGWSEVREQARRLVGRHQGRRSPPDHRAYRGVPPIRGAQGFGRRLKAVVAKMALLVLGDAHGRGPGAPHLQPGGVPLGGLGRAHLPKFVRLEVEGVALRRGGVGVGGREPNAVMSTDNVPVLVRVEVNGWRPPLQLVQAVHLARDRDARDHRRQRGALGLGRHELLVVGLLERDRLQPGLVDPARPAICTRRVGVEQAPRAAIKEPPGLPRAI